MTLTKGHTCRIESLEKNPYIYGHLIFNKSVKVTELGKELSFQQMVPGQLDIQVPKNDVGPISYYIQELIQNVSWAKCKSKNCKTFRRWIRINLHHLGVGNSFLDITPEAQVRKEKNRQTELY